MRDNGPVTGNEIPVGASDELVSATNTKGVITFCNDTFCNIAGFTQEELMRKAHNIVRHPDMPEAAFAQMWECLKAGKPWMGIVKNRCKNVLFRLGRRDLVLGTSFLLLLCSSVRSCYCVSQSEVTTRIGMAARSVTLCFMGAAILLCFAAGGVLCAL